MSIIIIIIVYQIGFYADLYKKITYFVFYDSWELFNLFIVRFLVFAHTHDAIYEQSF